MVAETATPLALVITFPYRCRSDGQCFGGNPCNRCQKRGFVCEFSQQVRQRGPNNKPASQLIAAAIARGEASPRVVSASAATASTQAAPSSASAASGPKPLLTTDPVKVHRRHSMPDNGPVASVPPAPSKTYSTNDVQTLSVQTNVMDANGTFSMPNSAVPSLPTPTAEYLTVPGQYSRKDAELFSDPQRSPGYSYTPESNDAAVGEYPYTPISPGTATFSPTLNMNPSTGPVYAQHIVSEEPRQSSQQWYGTAA